MIPKLVITDIDGVWTDGGMYYDEQGNEWKKFNTSDSAGVLFCRYLNIPVAIMTGEDVESVKRRAKKLKIDYLYTGAKDKVQLANDLCKDLGIDLSEVAFIGDDLNDIQLLRLVGISAAPSNAPKYVQSEVDFITKKAGGEGAFRDFIETILEKEGKLEAVIEMYFEKRSFKQ